MKKGFVFLETLAVIVVLSASVVGMFKVYTVVSSNIDSRIYYDNISDLYEVDILREELDLNKIEKDSDIFRITKDSCANYMSDKCAYYMSQFNVQNIFINNVNTNTLLNSTDVNVVNSLKQYLKTISDDENKRFIIVNFKRENKNYYASLRLGYIDVNDLNTELYDVNLNVVNGTVPSSKKRVTLNGEVTFIVTPNDGYTLDDAVVNCTGGTLTDNTLTITNIRKNITCEVVLHEDRPFKSGTLAAQILIDNPTINKRTNFGVTNTATTTGTIYQTNKTEDGSTVYYYSGNTTKNWVKFGGFYWRIIRTNEDKNVRLLYAGTSHDTTEGYMGDTYFSESSYGTMYAGYMYGTTGYGSLPGNRTNTNDSPIKTVIDTWYRNNLLTNYDKYISKTAIYCNDRSVGSGNFSSEHYNGAFTRLQDNYAPSYKCGENGKGALFESTQAIEDKFSASTTGGGNGQLTYPIAMMTADEITFAGGKISSESILQWYYQNSAGKSITSSNSWWLLTPYGYLDYATKIFNVSGNRGASGFLGSYEAADSYYVRPALSLKSCVKYLSGNGTPTSPYEVTIDDACASAEN